MSEQQPPQGYGPPPQGYGPQHGYQQHGYPPQQQPASKTPWYHSPVVMGLSLFCCWPIGLVLLWTSKTSMGWKIAGTAIFGGIGVIMTIGSMINASKTQSPTAATTPGAAPAAVAAKSPNREKEDAPQVEQVTESCFELAGIFGASSKLSDLQKEELWKQYGGKGFEWDLKITEVRSGMLGGFTVQAKCAPKSNSLIQDVQISYEDDAKNFVMSLEKDSVYKLKGVLNRSSTLLGLTADGRP